MEILQAETVRRRLPANLASEDGKLFAHELEKTVPATRLIELQDVTVLPNGFLVRGAALGPCLESFSNPVAGPVLTARRIARRVLSAPLQLSPLLVRHALLVTDEFSNGYFHWLGDCLPRLAVLAERGVLSGRSLVVPDYAGRFAYVRPSLAAFDIAEVIYPGRRRAARIQELTLVSPVAPTGNYRPAVMAQLRQKYLQRLGGTGSGRRLYASRARAPWRRVANEDALVSLLSRHRIERVFLEELSFDQEVRLLSETNVLVGSHGAGLTNMLFMQEGGRVVELRRAGDAANNCYFSLASDLGHSYHYVLCNPVQARRDTHTADVAVDLAQVDRVLRAL